MMLLTNLILSLLSLILILLPLALSLRYSPGNILLLDHLNINHEKTRHDLVKAFYYDALGLSPDPRKNENMEKGRKTIWANCGIHQFHLPESTNAQIFDGIITLAYRNTNDLSTVEKNLINCNPILKSCEPFTWSKVTNDHMIVTDPWGSTFRLIVDEDTEDQRGVQPGEKSLSCAMSDLCINVPMNCNIDGIGRFYKFVFNAPIITNHDNIQVVVSPQQTLTFKKVNKNNIDHSDIRTDENGKIGNHGPHISMYISDFVNAYNSAESINSLFVNYRFKRQATNIDEAISDCMFRCLDIVDPNNISNGPIIQIEHEVRSIVTSDGKLYKSCPFYEIPI